MLRAKGYQASVANAGISGDTTMGMLQRLDAAVPDGTELVILAIFPYNDADKGVSRRGARGQYPENPGPAPCQRHQDDVSHAIGRRPADAIGWNSPDGRRTRRSRCAFAAASDRRYRAPLTDLSPEFAVSTVISGHRVFQRAAFAS